MASQSPGKKIFTFSMWIMAVPFAAFLFLIVFVNLVVLAAAA